MRVPLYVHQSAVLTDLNGVMTVALRSLASEMAEQPGLPAGLLDVHVDDGTGHCAGCKWWDRPRPVHPCSTRSVAVRALRIQVEQVAGQVLDKGTTAPLA